MSRLPKTTWYVREAARAWQDDSQSVDVRHFHQSLPGYAPTPLLSLPDLATEFDVGAVWVKDESSRLDLPAFKILGASWAVAKVAAARYSTTVELQELRRAATGSALRLVTATDGNHGRAVARMAALIGVHATVFVPAVMSADAKEAIAAEGADVLQTRTDYDATVSSAAQFADDDPDRELVQDTSWPGYQQIPAWIVEGYDTLLREVDDALGHAPDLVAVPVGVGSLAQAVVSHYRRAGVAHPAVLSVEPDTASCLLDSLVAGTAVSVPTANTVMAGLNCGTVSAAAWPVLHQGCDGAVAVTDAAALRAVEDLRQLGLSSGPSGAATLAGLRAVLGSAPRRAALGVTSTSTVVLLSTEGRTR